jgi:hypothetical protein
MRERSGDLRAYESELAMLLSEEDVNSLAAAIEPGSSAGVLVWENTWAAPFISAVRRSGGQLAATGRIPAQTLLAAIRGLMSKKKQPTRDTELQPRKERCDMPLARGRYGFAAGVIGPRPWLGPLPSSVPPRWLCPGTAALRSARRQAGRTGVTARRPQRPPLSDRPNAACVAARVWRLQATGCGGWSTNLGPAEWNRESICRTDRQGPEDSKSAGPSPLRLRGGRVFPHPPVDSAVLGRWPSFSRIS